MGERGIPESFEFDSLPFIEDDVMEVLEMAMERVPVLKSAGIRTFSTVRKAIPMTGALRLAKRPRSRAISFWPA